MVLNIVKRIRTSEGKPMALTQEEVFELARVLFRSERACREAQGLLAGWCQSLEVWKE